MEEKAKTLEDRLIDTFLPVHFWYLLARLEWIGPSLTKDQVRQLARFFLPPPDRLVRNIRRTWAEFLNPALYSPTWRRCLRKQAIRILQEQRDEGIREKDPVMFAARESFAQFRASLETSDPPNWDCIAALGSARDFEEAQWQKLSTLAENPAVLDALFPPRKTLDSHLRKRVLGVEEYRLAIVELLADFLLEGKSEAEPRLTRKSEIWEILGLDYDDFHGPKRLPEAIAARRLFDAILSCFAPPDEAKLTGLTHWLIKSHLPRALLGTGYYVRVRSIDEPVSGDLTLSHIIPHPTAQAAFASLEKWVDYEVFLEDIPAAQRRSVQYKELAEKTGVTLKEVCAAKGEDYSAVRRNLSRARKRWRD